MLELKEIPDDVKWRLAAQCAASLPAMYDVAFRAVVGARYDTIEQEIWMELARLVYDAVRDLALPVKNARELATSMQIIMTIFFGPDNRGEAFEVSSDGAVLLIKRCPLLESGYTRGAGDIRTFHKCMALVLTTIPLLNNKYSARYVRTMCTGDRQCEIKIEAQKQTEQKKPERKQEP